MRGLFIPDITAEMFKNGCLESIEVLMAEGEIYDIDYSPWIPVSERLPEKYGEYLITWTTSQSKRPFVGISEGEVTGEYDYEHNRFKFKWLLDDYIKAYSNVEVIAWMPLPKPYVPDINIGNMAESPENIQALQEYADWLPQYEGEWVAESEGKK